MLTIENATVTATFADGVRYVHEYVTSITINNPSENALAVSPQGGGDGIPYKVNTTAPVVLDMIVRKVAAEFLSAYKTAHKDQARISFMVTDVDTGERYDFNNSIVRTDPTNRTITDGEGALDIPLNVNTAQRNFVHVPGEDL
jgi:hypothetical protein